MSPIRPGTPPKHPGMFILHKLHPICFPLFRRLPEKPVELESMPLTHWSQFNFFLYFPPRLPRAINILLSHQHSLFLWDQLYFLRISFHLPYNVYGIPKKCVWDRMEIKCNFAIWGGIGFSAFNVQ